MKFKYLFLAAGLLMGMSGCDDKLETFETVGEIKAPTAIESTAIHYESLPGQIRLYWTVTEDPGFEYLKVYYYDHMSKEDVTLLVSKYTGEVLIDNTLARFGDYTFAFQTFNHAFCIGHENPTFLFPHHV